MSIAAVSTTATAPLAAATPLAAVDVGAFASRAEAWTAARTALRADAEAQAAALAAEVRQAELDRIAAEEAAREAELARQRAAEEAARTTTTAPPTTAPPTTTTAPPTTTEAPTDPPADEPATTTTTAAPAEPSPGSPTATQWDVLRQCESSGNYSIVSSNGRYRGAYQFSQATWDWIAGIGLPGLVGVDPAQASPGDQDAMALLLWERQGWRPWPVCGQQAAAA